MCCPCVFLSFFFFFFFFFFLLLPHTDMSDDGLKGAMERKGNVAL
jgi:hypothetical protein